MVSHVTVVAAVASLVVVAGVTSCETVAVAVASLVVEVEVEVVSRLVEPLGEYSLFPPRYVVKKYRK